MFLTRRELTFTRSSPIEMHASMHTRASCAGVAPNTIPKQKTDDSKLTRIIRLFSIFCRSATTSSPSASRLHRNLAQAASRLARLCQIDIKCQHIWDRTLQEPITQICGAKMCSTSGYGTRKGSARADRDSAKMRIISSLSSI